MEEFSIEKARAEIRKALNLDVMRAILGDKDGNIYVPGQPGMLYVRLPSSDGKYTVPTTARVGGTFSVQPGAPVLLKRDADGALSVFSADYAAQMQSGYDPRANNAADLNIYGFLSQRQIATLRCQPVPGALAVSVKAWVFVDAEGRLHEFEGDTIALQAPSTSGEHYLAAVFLGTLGLEVHYSTAKPVADDLDSEDVQECLDKRSPLAVPIAVWRLVSGMTELPDSALYYDFRQFVNIPAPRHNYSAQTAPTTSDDATRGYSAGSLWFDLGTQRAWLCLNNSPGAAVWKDIGGSSSASSPTTTHGDIIVRGPTADARLPIGPDGAFLRVDTTAPLKVDWQPSVRALTSRSVAQRVLLAELTLSDPQHTIDIPNLASAYDGLYIEARLSTSATSVQSCSLYLNGDFTASSYVGYLA
ncbi:MAG: hypothetical protein KatS3mg038_1045 [Candidatus Kapaibacterium sp.]|nr:MAG: hypothetical protein KatS3mg038_1045 [Candidatus Kapabacteria bacterium]